ncbi:hypothetical protein MMC30_005290 [Trapelia coarctata]|nr:hypothetical protein [Trapelia coarctata]
MPHTSHKKGNAQDKQRTVAGADGWTHVVRGPPSRTLTVDRYRTVIAGLTPEKLEEHSAEVAKKWKATAMYEHLERFFEQKILNEQNLRITSCVCIGLGSFSTEFGRPDRCLTQLAALESMLELLGRKHTIEQVFVQDPRFNELDKGLISSKCFTLLEAPAAEACAGPNTFVFAPFVPWQAIAKILKAPIPLMICNSLVHYFDIWPREDRHSGEPLEKELFMLFLCKRALYQLPEYTGEQEAFSGLDGLAVYWKDDAENES